MRQFILVVLPCRLFIRNNIMLYSSSLFVDCISFSIHRHYPAQIIQLNRPVYHSPAIQPVKSQYFSPHFFLSFLLLHLQFSIFVPLLCPPPYIPFNILNSCNPVLALLYPLLMYSCCIVLLNRFMKLLKCMLLTQFKIKS